MRRCIAIVVVSIMAFALPANAQFTFEYAGTGRDPIPPDGSPWHEIWPAYCNMANQDSYEDNGDGVVSTCDYITLSGTRYHIEWAGPTYWLEDPAGGEPWGAEPTEPQTGGDPTCEVWHEVYPQFCMEHHIEGWDDNGDGVLGVCDYIVTQGQSYHIVEVSLNITVTPVSPVEQSTWGKIKAFFSELL